GRPEPTPQPTPAPAAKARPTLVGSDPMTDDVLDLDATAQAERVGRGELKPAELGEAAIRRLEARTPALGAFIHLALERALERSRSASLEPGPFRGVPFAMKDLGGGEAGRPHPAGMAFLKRAGWVEREDAFLTRKLRAAGLISLGRTNTPELALLVTTEPEAYGP